MTSRTCVDLTDSLTTPDNKLLTPQAFCFLDLTTFTTHTFMNSMTQTSTKGSAPFLRQNELEGYTKSSIQLTALESDYTAKQLTAIRSHAFDVYKVHLKNLPRAPPNQHIEDSPSLSTQDRISALDSAINQSRTLLAAYMSLIEEEKKSNDPQIRGKQNLCYEEYYNSVQSLKELISSQDGCSNSFNAPARQWRSSANFRMEDFDWFDHFICSLWVIKKILACNHLW